MIVASGWADVHPAASPGCRTASMLVSCECMLSISVWFEMCGVRKHAWLGIRKLLLQPGKTDPAAHSAHIQ